MKKSIKNKLEQYNAELDALEQEAKENLKQREEIQNRIAEIRSLAYKDVADTYIGKYFKDDDWCEETLYFHVINENDGKYHYRYFCIEDDDVVSKPYLDVCVSAEQMYNSFRDYAEITEAEFEEARQAYKKIIADYMAKIDEV